MTPVAAAKSRFLARHLEVSVHWTRTLPVIFG
jgi:hypothetical protein